jgi:hypothetical protein
VSVPVSPRADMLRRSAEPVQVSQICHQRGRTTMDAAAQLWTRIPALQGNRGRLRTATDVRTDLAVWRWTMTDVSGLPWTMYAIWKVWWSSGRALINAPYRAPARQSHVLSRGDRAI